MEEIYQELSEAWEVLSDQEQEYYKLKQLAE